MRVISERATSLAHAIVPKVAKTTLAVFAYGLVSGLAYAHPVLQSSDPAQDATVAAPKEVRLTFTEDVIPKFSGLAINDNNGGPVETGNPSNDPKDKRQLIVPIVKSLSAGTYNVDWHAVSADTHRVKGHFSFKVSQ